MEAGMVTTNTPGGALAARPMLPTCFVELDTTLVPELVTAAQTGGGVAKVAGPVGEGSLRRGFAVKSR